MEATTPQATPSMPEPATYTSQVNGTPGTESLKRKRQPRNSACQGCSQLKMKCISQPNGVCVRCDRVGRACVLAQPKARKRRTVNGFSEMDRPATEHFPTTNGPPLRFDRTDSQKNQRQPDGEALLAGHDLTLADGRSFASLFSHCLGSSNICEELLDGIDHNFVLDSRTRFQQLVTHFPFVDISSGEDVVMMVARRPMLTLAVCIVVSTLWPDLQDRLSQAFLHALANRFMLGDDRSFDLFTGLLVYLGWQHQYLSQQKTYQKLCLLAGMATDLGLYRSGPHATTWSALEEGRAFIGAYYLCTGLSAKHPDKPSPLRWTDNLRHWAEQLARSGTLPTDRALPNILALAHTMDDLENTLRDRTSQPATKSYVDLSTTAALQRLAPLHRSPHPHHPLLDLTSATIRIHHKRLRHGTNPDPSILIKCACAVKEYLDDLLTRPPATLHQIAVVEWADFLEILLVMADVSRASVPTAGWEAGAVAEMLRPDEVLDEICGWMRSATPADDDGSVEVGRSSALCERVGEICRVVKRGWGVVQRDGETGLEAVQDAGVLDLEFWAAVSSKSGMLEE